MSKRTRAVALGWALAAACAVSIVATANQPPIARISAYRAEGATVVYDASTSSDPDGRIVRFQWTFGDSATGSGTTVAHAYAQVNSFSVTLLVGDDQGATTFATQTIDVAALPSQLAVPASTAPSVTPTAPAAQVPVGDDVGQRAPEIALPDVTGGMVHLSSYLGHPVLVEFWLSTCPGCQASTPRLESLRSMYAAQDLIVLLVVLDRNASAAAAFLRQYGYTNFVLAWESDARKPTMTAYGVSVTPHAILVDRTGVIRYSGHPNGLADEFLARWI